MMRMKKRLLFSRIVSVALLSVLLFFIVPLIGSPVVANPVKQPIKKQSSIPAIFLEWGNGAPDYAILLDKSLQKVMVYRKDNLFIPEKVYTCSTGENGGPKSKKNDRIEMNLVVNKDMSIHQSHHISEVLKKIIQKEYGPCEIDIHFDPCDENCKICKISCTKKTDSDKTDTKN